MHYFKLPKNQKNHKVPCKINKIGYLLETDKITFITGKLNEVFYFIRLLIDLSLPLNKQSFPGIIM